MAAGRGRSGQRGGRGGRSGRGARAGPRPPPPPPPPPLPPPPDHAAAASANSIEDSPATRTRRQLMLALQSGSHSADSHGGREGRGRAADVIEDSSTRRTRQRLAVASHVCAPGNADMMQRLFADTDRSEEEDDDDDGEDDPTFEEPVAPPIYVPAADSRQVVQEGVVQYGNRQQTNVGKDWLLEKCVKEDVFPKQKFANLNGDLDFSNNRNSICRFMAEKMKVQEADVEGWWESSKKAVHKKLKNHRNNVIKTIKTNFNGKMVATDFCDIMLAMHYHF
jgi:hypothetical protein